MLRIETLDTAETPTGSVARIRLVGRVSDRWVDELRRVATDLLSDTGGLDIQMDEVSYVDAAGLRLFRELSTRRVTLRDCALFVAEQLKTLDQDGVQ